MTPEPALCDDKSFAAFFREPRRAGIMALQLLDMIPTTEGFSERNKMSGMKF